MDAVRQRDGRQRVVQRDQGALHALALASTLPSRPSSCSTGITSAFHHVLLHQHDYALCAGPLPNALDEVSDERALGRLTSSSVSA